MAKARAGCSNVKPLLLIILLTSAISAQAQWRPLPWDRTETAGSIAEAVGVGAAIPTITYLCYNRISPTHRPQKRMARIMITHVATMGLAVCTMRGPSRHDTDPRYTNVLLMAGASCFVNLIVDGFRNGLWMKKVSSGIKKNS
jgi:hypothetical protein